MSPALLTSLFLSYKYPLIFIVTLVEGPIIMVMSGLLLHLGIASFWPIYLTLMAGDIVGDTIWYHAGYYFAEPLTNRYGKFFGLTPELIQKTTAIFRNHERKILFISKLTMGLGVPLATLVVAGMTKMSFRKYIVSLFFGQIIFTGILLSVGYFFGNLYVKINKDFQILSAIGFFILIFLVIKGVRSYLKKKNLGLNS